MYILIILLIGLYVYVCRTREPFVSTGFQIHDDFYKNQAEELIKNNVKHIIIIPFIGMNQLHFFSKKVKEINTSFEKVYIFSVDMENERLVSNTKEFMSTLCPDILDLPNAQVVVLTKNNTFISNKYMYSESTDTVMLHKINSLFASIK
jgi:hypothetical protein